MRNILCGALVLCGVAGASAATVIVPSSADTTLHGAFGVGLDLRDNNMGGLPHVAVGSLIQFSGSQRALYRFDVTGPVPAGATVTAVKLNFAVTKVSGGSGPTLRFHRVLQSWTEGNKAGATPNQGEPATAGETTWNNRAHPSTPWAAPGADGPADAATTASATISIDAAASYSLASTAALVADVQAWTANSASNFGWLIKPTGGARFLNSRETPGGGPTLEITYTEAVATDIHINSIEREPSGLTFTWTGGLPQYQIATATNILGPWTLVGAKISVTNATAALPGTTTFYRVAGQVP